MLRERFLLEKKVKEAILESQNKVIMVLGASDTGKTTLIEDKEKVLKLHSIRGKKYSQQGDPTDRVFVVIRLEPSKAVTLRL